MSERHALVIEDTPANRDFFERLLTQANFQVSGASSSEEALEIVAKCPDLSLAIIDMELPDGNGLLLTKHLREQFPNAFLVVATMHDQRSLMVSVSENGGNCFMVKPHGFMELFRRLTTTDTTVLREGEFTIIDQYGPRGFTTA